MAKRNGKRRYNTRSSKAEASTASTASTPESPKVTIVSARADSLPKPPTSTGIDGVPVLVITKVDQCLYENGKAHRTSKYELMHRDEGDARLVVRRGQEFFIRLTLDRDYDPNVDGVSIALTLDGIKTPNYGSGTFVVTPVLNSGEVSEGAWQASVHSVEKNSMKIKIVSPADVLIGKWKLDVDAKRKDMPAALTFSVKEPLYIIFNAWCPADPVFMEGDEEREEYVLADTGLIWRGSHREKSHTVWKYAQFEKDILDCSLYLLTHVTKIRPMGLKDPVLITRKLSAAVNAQDDNGVLSGNWSNDYAGGTSPCAWLGSQKILQEYWKTKQPVKYGQCWVFAGVLTTVCRALGMPSRVVTNFLSAHDTDGSLTLDYFVDSEGNIMEDLSNDSTWNFHVWNEAWMKRCDLGPEYAGWQAIDATPQERSEGTYRCGPASVTAIKRGEIQRPYDNAFLFGEVNADKVFWRYNGPTQPLKLIKKDTDSIGRHISTKAVGSWTREDITHMYKFPEKTSEERETMLKALRQSESLFSRYYLNEEFNDIMFDFELLDEIIIGQPFSVVLVIQNRSDKVEYKVSANLKVEVVMYTGKVHGTPIKRSQVDRTVKPGALEKVQLDVSWDEYGPRLLNQCSFNMACLATVKDTDFEYYAQDDFRVKKPKIEIEVGRTAEPVVNEIIEMTASFKNPLPIPLKKGQFLIQGPGLDKQLTVKLSKDVAPNGHATCSFAMTPRRKGKSTILAKFHSKELDDVDGFLNVTIKPAKCSSIGYL